MLQTSHCENNGISLSVSTLRYAPKLSFNNTIGSLIAAGSGCAQSSLSNANLLKGNIALLTPNGCYPQEKIFQAQEAGAIAAVVVSYQKAFGLLDLYYNGLDTSKITIPAWEISIETYEKLHKQLKETNQLNVIILAGNTKKKYASYLRR
jgi:hypothetical protein